MKKIYLMMIPLVLLASCQQKGETVLSTGVKAIDTANLDLSVAPGQNFYKYAVGGWQQNNPLKPEFARFGSFDALRDNNVIRLNDLFADMATMRTKKGSVDQKIVDLYKQGLDSTRLNAEGSQPIKPYLDQIYAVTNKAELVNELALLNKTGDGGFFGLGAEADLMNSDMQILYLTQGGLGMGDRDYYVDPSNAALHEGYLKMLVKFCSLAGLPNPETKAANCLKVEDSLAECSWTSVQNRDIEKQYNPMSTEELSKAYPGFDFKSFLNTLGIAEQEKIIVMQPSFFEGFNKIFEETELEVLKDYVAAQFISGAASSLSDDFYTTSFDFFSTQMSGITEQKPRWKRAMSVPNSILGEAVGQMYVQKYFPEEYKNKVLNIVKDLQASLKQHIDNLDWMTDETKKYAQEKLASFTVKIGYPDKWKDYSDLNIDPELSYYDNLRAASAWHVSDNLSKLGKKTDRSEWGMTPQTVNAYYNPTTNEICFPAAILQPPFFNADADDAVNYGAIGVVIGHEMTHGFDDQGRLFDKDGNMTNWWKEEDAVAFKDKTSVLEKQFNEVEILPGLMANGALSLGENIADQGGISIAYSALHNSLGDKEVELIDSMTVDQRFFIGYAQVWAQNITDEEKARLTKLDVHSLAVNRVNVTVRNFQIFFDAFGITEKDPMWRPVDERVMIW